MSRPIPMFIRVRCRLRRILIICGVKWTPALRLLYRNSSFMPETFLRFRDKLTAAGILVPLAAGIMPIQNLAQVVKFAGGCGTIVPDGFAKRFERHGDECRCPVQRRRCPRR